MKTMNRFRWILPALVLATAGAALPARADASCTGDYERCLNDSWETSGFARVLADVECLAGYAGCLRRLVMD